MSTPRAPRPAPRRPLLEATLALGLAWPVVGCGRAEHPAAPASGAANPPSVTEPTPARAVAAEPEARALDALALQEPAGQTRVDDELRRAMRALATLPKKADLWVTLGRGWVKKARGTGDPGYYLNADAAAKRALALEPENAAALDLRGLVLLNGHAFREARALAEQVLARDPDDAMALGTLSDAALELGDLPAATEAAQRMVERKPDLPSYARASYLRWLQGDVKGAIEAMRLAFDAGRGQRDKEPTAWVLTQLAGMFWATGDLEGAAEGYALTLRHLPDYPPALVGLARTHLSSSRPAEATPLLERAQATQPLPETAWLLADARRALGDVEGAARWDAEVERLGTQADHRTLAAFLATRRRDLDRALRLSAEELAARPGPLTRDVHAFVLARAGRAEEALRVAEPLAGLDVPDPAVRWHQAVVGLGSRRAADVRRARATLAALAKTHPRFDLTFAAEQGVETTATQATARAVLAVGER